MQLQRLVATSKPTSVPKRFAIAHSNRGITVLAVEGRPRHAIRGPCRLQFRRHVGETEIAAPGIIEALPERHCAPSYRQATGRARFAAPPSEHAAMLIRPPSRPAIATLNPMPSSPKRLATGTRAGSRRSPRGSAARSNPSCVHWHQAKAPACPPSTTSVEMPPAALRRSAPSPHRYRPGRPGNELASGR